MSHWLPVSTSADERSYNPCPGCSYNIPAFSKKSVIKQRCNSEKCFFQVALSENTGYPTKNAKVFVAYLPITLSTSWSYATFSISSAIKWPAGFVQPFKPITGMKVNK
ncbi:hypothetical protein RhiirA1_478212 [Rhizophagus irregularis]|uniref:Uncharacterized protein n=1 Tax=Rhizophagus irregularis TaxID=588596 RepID=A0A2N0QSE1_9GLOM|nr:hypothetical protein RhiirA1_478212 [Rhizophagus irregularis]